MNSVPSKNLLVTDPKKLYGSMTSFFSNQNLLPKLSQLEKSVKVLRYFNFFVPETFIFPYKPSYLLRLY